MDEACREKIVSENYADFIWQTNVREEDIREIYPDVCVQRINDYYTVFYADRKKWTADRERLYEYSYELFPTLYTTLQTENLEASGILALQNQPVLNLRGQGVLLGFIDTGIDYRNRCFLDKAGKSRILGHLGPDGSERNAAGGYSLWQCVYKVRDQWGAVCGTAL